MKILFLGTGAADYTGKEKEFRRNSSALIDDIILIDPGKYVIDAIKEFKVDVSKIKYILNTHRHDDHFNENTLSYLVSQGATFIDTKPNDIIELGEYRILALRGNHTVPTCHFIIEHEGKRMFYGLDGGWLMYEEIDAIWKKGVDLAVFDATVGFVEGDYRIFEHTSLNMILDMKKSINTAIKKYVISHMAYTLHTDHKTLEAEMKKHGIITAYDGLTIEF
ncbi:MAG: MBL fold metallo-hydrolase [Clostridia bacterium]|nr:MBL fold metallo-hydrolase [Clostridia bacterium]MBO5440234.1 MBL fold metallo-hydrolase [Clostridia bacterium]